MSLKSSTADDAILSKIVDRDDGYQMPPPDAGRRPKKIQKRALHSRIVLEEDPYVDALSQIIERDYFPDTAKLRRHLELLNAHDNNDTAAISVLHRQILAEQRRSTPSSQSYRHGQSLPLTESDSEEVGAESQSSVQISGLTVDGFLREYTSEDNESFEKLQERDLEKWRQARHWAYESKVAIEDGDYEKRPGMLMLYHMGGRVLSVQERGHFDALLELPKSVGDDKPNNLDTWRLRVRNQLMFPPSLEDSQAPKADSNADHSATSTNHAHLIDDSRSAIADGAETSNTQLSIHKSSRSTINKWVGTNTRAEKIIQRSNTSLRHLPDVPAAFSHSGITPSPLEPPHSPSVQSESLSECASTSYHEAEIVLDPKKKAYRILSMTPSPMPGGGGESPIMTWGVIGGTPLILDPPESRREAQMLADLNSASCQRSLLAAGMGPNVGAGYRGTMYQPPPVQQRELLAHSLGAREKSRKASVKEAGKADLGHSSGHSSSLRRSSKSSSGHSVSATSRLHYRQLTPAALSLAARLSGAAGGSKSSHTDSGASNPFSCDALTQSYTRPAGGSRKGSQHVGGRSGRKDKRADLAHSSIPQSPMNTDNLLNL